jgi:hypothetical protein
MNNNTFWILFWALVFSYGLSTTYIKEQTKQKQAEIKLKIVEMNCTPYTPSTSTRFPGLTNKRTILSKDQK